MMLKDSYPMSSRAEQSFIVFPYSLSHMFELEKQNGHIRWKSLVISHSYPNLWHSEFKIFGKQVKKFCEALKGNVITTYS